MPSTMYGKVAVQTTDGILGYRWVLRLKCRAKTEHSQLGICIGLDASTKPKPEINSDFMAQKQRDIHTILRGCFGLAPLSTNQSSFYGVECHEKRAATFYRQARSRFLDSRSVHTLNHLNPFWRLHSKRTNRIEVKLIKKSVFDPGSDLDGIWYLFLKLNEHILST